MISYGICVFIWHPNGVNLDSERQSYADQPNWFKQRQPHFHVHSPNSICMSLQKFVQFNPKGNQIKESGHFCANLSSLIEEESVT